MMAVAMVMVTLVCTSADSTMISCRWVTGLTAVFMLTHMEIRGGTGGASLDGTLDQLRLELGLSLGLGLVLGQGVMGLLEAT